MIETLSDISRTNQLQITEPPEETAEKLFQYLFKMGKGIEHFSIKGQFTKEEYSKPDFYKKRHKVIKTEVQKRLAVHGEKQKLADIQYFFSYSGGKNYVFFLSPNKHSGWKDLFCDQWGTSNRERILNLVFKFYLLSQELPIETINGFEELLLMHSASSTKSKKGIVVWGQNLLLKYNRYKVLTLTLSRKSRLFLQEDQFNVLDGEELGELLVYKNKNYYFNRDRDARAKNSIKFMHFPKDNKDYDKFQQTQLYHYQNLMTKLEGLLDECNISYDTLPFQADHYLANPFIKNVESVDTVEIINNSGIDLTELDKLFLQNFLKQQGECTLSFYNNGKTISTYKEIMVEDEKDSSWKITEVVPWANINLDIGKNYLIFNKQFNEDVGSMAYQGDDGLWYPSTKINSKDRVDFYSQLKRRLNYVDKGRFFSTQGMNLDEFKAVSDGKSSWSLLTYTENKIDKDSLYEDTKDFTDGNFLGVENSIAYYLTGQKNGEQWGKFCDKYKIKISPEFQKVLIELGIKNWIRESLANSDIALAVESQPFSEKRFFAIYVRNPKKQKAKAVAVEFLYKEGGIYIKNVLRDLKEIQKRFPFLRKRYNSDELINDQQYFVDEAEKLHISCYTDNYYTPTLIGRYNILEEMDEGKLEIDRKKFNLLPLVLHYHKDVKQTMKNLICLDLKRETFIQYYVPPTSIRPTVGKGFRVYHLIGFDYSKKAIPTDKLIQHPITMLHFNTLTQNVLRISDNSQSSLLQKVAKVFIEN